MTGGVVRRDGLREEIARELVARHFDGNGCGTHDHMACSNCFGPSPMSAHEIADEVMRVLDAVPVVPPTEACDSKGWRVSTAAELNARIEALTPAERLAASWRDGYRTGYYEHALGRPNRLHPDTSTPVVPPDPPAVDEVSE